MFSCFADLFLVVVATSRLDGRLSIQWQSGFRRKTSYLSCGYSSPTRRTTRRRRCVIAQLTATLWHLPTHGLVILLCAAETTDDDDEEAIKSTTWCSHWWSDTPSVCTLEHLCYVYLSLCLFSKCCRKPNQIVECRTDGRTQILFDSSPAAHASRREDHVPRQCFVILSGGISEI